jgi:23S rRNA pseudouridine2605 synthase
MLERLQKIIARAGIASRRHAEELIKSGLVTVNGQTVTELGSKAEESTDHIKVQGKLLRPQSERVYLLLNKPPEVVSTMIDPEGRRTLTDLLHGVSQRVFPVGRLEYHSMGLVFLTNDGELANRMLKAHPLPQTYHLKLKDLLTFEEIETLARTTSAHITRLKGKDAPWYEVTLSEARRDALRNRLFQTGHPVEKIKRVKIGNLAMESLSTGHHRPLSDAEVATLRKLVQPGTAQPATFAAQEDPQAALPAQFRDATPAAFDARPPACVARRPFVKRRLFQPKPKPGESARPNQASPRSESFRHNQNFKSESPSALPGKKPFQRSRPSEGPRSAASERPEFGAHDRPPRGPKSSPPWRSSRKPSEPDAFGRAKKGFRPSGSSRANAGTKSNPTWKSSHRPAEPGAFGRREKTFRPGRPAGSKSGGPRRAGPPDHKPKRGGFTGPKGRS